MRDVIFTIALVVAAALVAVGIGVEFGVGFACIAAGILVAGISWLVLADVPAPPAVGAGADEDATT